MLPMTRSSNINRLWEVRKCEGFSDADQARSDELFPTQASEKRQGRKSRSGAALQLAIVYGELMLSVGFVALLAADLTAE